MSAAQNLALSTQCCLGDTLFPWRGRRGTFYAVSVSRRPDGGAGCTDRDLSLDRAPAARPTLYDALQRLVRMWTTLTTRIGEAARAHEALCGAIRRFPAHVTTQTIGGERAVRTACTRTDMRTRRRDYELDTRSSPELASGRLYERPWTHAANRNVTIGTGDWAAKNPAPGRRTRRPTT
ncbi:hypothetical protein EXIGLDRAFT_284043 [Exidia glandulosa HHB12029]|uniref:Uncharacterized protein n=1 Tax=Exidia glandulosa HHB12029 TaxID=1314781 RepID=A0A165DHJ4_EXIGL|nr:hypothetical protein EXIGLDRAFT_284043 [Exidia glandulosa HHB12029]